MLIKHKYYLPLNVCSWPFVVVEFFTFLRIYALNHQSSPRIISLESQNQIRIHDKSMVKISVLQQVLQKLNHGEDRRICLAILHRSKPANPAFFLCRPSDFYAELSHRQKCPTFACKTFIYLSPPGANRRPSD